MNYIVFDLEFNQDLPSLQASVENVAKCPYEIIQIGAVKIDLCNNTISAFNRYIKPSIFLQVNTFVTELTGISTEQLSEEDPFPKVYYDYLDFIGTKDAVFCVWGMSDIKELYRNAAYYQLDKTGLPELYINLQPHTSAHLNIPGKKLLKLESAVEALGIDTPYQFHNALYDAYYTAEIFNKIYTSAMQPKRYNPNYVAVPPRQPKQVIDFDRLLQQFIKMYGRELSQEEAAMIKLAYKMGRTKQFVTEMIKQEEK